LTLAQELEDYQLVGEQQILLAFALADLDRCNEAATYCRQAIATYQGIGETALAEKAQALLAEL
jgi:hypothetical protein